MSRNFRPQTLVVVIFFGIFNEHLRSVLFMFLPAILVPEAVRKLRETPGKDSHQVRSKSERSSTSYDKKTKKVNCPPGVELNSACRFVFAGLGGPGGGLGGFQVSSKSRGKATTATTKKKAAKTTTRTTQTSKNKTKNKTKNNV